MTVDVEVPRYRGAVSQIGSGVLTTAKGSLQLVLFLASSGFGVVGRVATLPIRRGLARKNGPAQAEVSAPTAQARVVEIVPVLGRVSRLRGTAFRLGLAGLVIGGLAAGAVVFTKLRARKQLPEPASAPPAVRSSTNGAGNLVTYVEIDKN